MSTKTRRARKVRAGDVVDFGGQPFQACRNAEAFEPGMVSLTGHAASEADCHSVIRLPADTRLNVQRLDKAEAPRSAGGSGPSNGPIIPEAKVLEDAIRDFLGHLES